MKLHFLSGFLFFLMGCTSGPENNAAPKTDRILMKTAITHTPEWDTIANVPNPPVETNEKWKIDTLRVNKQTLLMYTGRLEALQGITTLKGDTIVTFEEGYHDAIFPDINGDGYKDIEVEYVSNYPDYATYLFDPKQRTYCYVQNCDLALTRIKNTPYYYSYTPAGCADSNWESYLSTIVDYKQIDLGLIKGQGCEGTSETPKIDIYVVNHDSHRFYKTLPYQKHIPEFGAKWDFIDGYWKKNYRQFTY